MLVNGKQISSLKSLESKVIVAEVTVIDDGRVQSLLVFHHNRVEFIRDERGGGAGFRVDVVMEKFDNIREDFRGLFVQVGDRDAGCQDRVLGMLGGHRGGGLSRQLIQLHSGDSGIDTLHDLLGDDSSIHMLGVQTIAQLVDAGCDLVEVHHFSLAVSL